MVVRPRAFQIVTLGETGARIAGGSRVSAHALLRRATALAGELLAAWLDNEPLPLPREVAEACHPNRFAVRQLSRGQ